MINFGSSDVKVLTKNFYADDKRGLWVWDKNIIKTFIDVYDLCEERIPFPIYPAGHLHEIILFKNKKNWDTRDDISDIEFFTCCLISPPYYIESVWSNGYSGLIMKSFAGSYNILTNAFNQYKLQHKKIGWSAFIKENIVVSDKRSKDSPSKK